MSGRVDNWVRRLSPARRLLRTAVLPGILVAALGLGGTTAVRAEDDQAEAPAAPELIAQGKSLYTQLCSHCHGVNMVNAGTSSFDLRRFPHDDHARFLNSVTHGKNTMPAWGDMLEPGEIEALWAYIRTGGKGS